MESLLRAGGIADHAIPAISFILNTILKGTLILFIAYGCSLVLKRASAATRHFVWTMAISGILLLPVISFVLPSWEISISPAFLTEKTMNPLSDSSGRPEVLASPEISALDKSVPTNTRSETQMNGTDKNATHQIKTQSRAIFQSLTGTVQKFAHSALNNQFSVLLCILWAAGTMFIFLHQLIGRMHVWKTGRRSVRVTDREWMRLFNDLKASCRIRRPVQLLKNDSIHMPMTWGFRKPKILLPAEAESWPDDRKRFVLLHELSHIKRWDTLTQLFAQIAGALYWMNPFVWLANRRFLSEREHACDDFVLKGGSKASEYAGLILDIAQSSHPRRIVSLATVAMARKTQLEGRLLAILNPRLSRQALTRVTAFLIGAAVLLAVFPLAAMQPTIRRQALLVSSPLFEKAEQVAEPKAIQNANETKESGKKSKGSPDEQLTGSPVNGESSQRIPRQTKSKQDKKNHVILALCEALKDPSLDVRIQAAEALRRLEDKTAVQPLILALKDDHWQMRAAAAEALGDLEDKSAVPGLIELLNDEDWHVREQALESLGDLKDPAAIKALSQAAQDPNRAIRKLAVWAMGEMQDRSTVAPLSLALKDEDWEIRQEASEALGKLEDDSAVSPLSAALSDPVMEVRKAVIHALDYIDSPKTMEPLCQALTDEHWEIRKAAAEAVGDLEDTRPIRSLITLVKSDPYWEVRKEAVEALQSIGDNAAVGTLIDALNDSNTEVCKAAVSALGDFENPRAVKPLLNLLENADTEIRMEIVQALGEIGDMGAAQGLRPLLQDENHELRIAAIEAIGEIKDRGSESVDALIQALTDPDGAVRKKAAQALGEIGDLKALDPLSLLLKDENEEVRRAAAEALGDLRWRNE